MEQNKTFRNKPTYRWSINLCERSQEHTIGLGTVINKWCRKTEYPKYAKECNWTTILHYTQVITQNGLKS